MDSIAMVESEETEAEMLEAIKFAHDIKIKFLLNAFASCFWKKKSSLTNEKKRSEAIYAKVSGIL
jgi:hypothetical protein